MTPRPPGFVSRNIVVADDDKAVIGLVIETLLYDGHAVFQAYDGLSASQLVHNLKVCHLLISNTRVDGKPGIDLIKELRKGLLILREPFTADELREAVGSLLPRRVINSDGQR